jgi:hypothetical protein
MRMKLLATVKLRVMLLHGRAAHHLRVRRAMMAWGLRR